MSTAIQVKGRLLDLHRPVVMGILNITPDSFFDGGRLPDLSAVLRQAEKMLRDGAAILDIGGASSRPGAAPVSESEELARAIPAVEAIARAFPEAFLSIDTDKPAVAKTALSAGAGIWNDVSGGTTGTGLEGAAPRILMHIKGTPQNMQQAPHYDDVVTEVLDFFVEKVGQWRSLGAKDIILDPGFGFGKTVEHNYALLKNLHVFRQVLGLPVLAGISRKSMICRPLGIKPTEALNGTTALHMVALQQGASILRAHDVKEAIEVIRLWEMI
jgi:dihydropteroate synthase